MNRYYDKKVNFLVSIQQFLPIQVKSFKRLLQVDSLITESGQVIRISCFFCFASNILKHYIALHLHTKERWSIVQMQVLLQY